MPLRDRAPSTRISTAETLAHLEQQISSLRTQISERFELLQVSEVDRKTAKAAPEFEREYELITLPFRGWDPGAILTAKSLADGGSLEKAADLWESVLADDRVAAAMEQRINGLEGLPVRFTGDGEDVLSAISTDYWQMMTPGDRAAVRRWGLGLGVCPVYVSEWIENTEGRMVPICHVWHPRFLQWRQSGDVIGKNEWWIQTSKTTVRLADQPGRWFLYTPFSGAGQRPWVNGLWYSSATWWLAKSFGIADLASFSQSHATPKWFLMPKEGAQISRDEKAEAIRRLAALPQRSGMYVPAGFEIDQKEASSGAWNAITALIDLANKALTVRILGSDSTTDKESSYASSAGGMQLLYTKYRTDADAESAFWHDGPLQYWYLLNFKGTRKLEDRRVLDLEVDQRAGAYRLLAESDRTNHHHTLRQLSEQIRAGDAVPWPSRDATPPQDMAAVADTQGKAAAALVQLTAAAGASPDIAAAVAQIDVERYLERFFPLKKKAESGVQLSLEADDDDVWMLARKSSKGKTGSGWITVNGTHIHAEPGKAIDFGALRMTKGGDPKPQRTTAADKKKEEDDWVKANTKPTDSSDLEAWSKFASRPNASYNDRREAQSNVDKAIERLKRDPSIEQVEYIAQHSNMTRENLIKRVTETKPYVVQYQTTVGIRAVDKIESDGIDGIPASDLKSGLDVARNKLLMAKSSKDLPSVDANDRPLAYVHQLNPKVFGSIEAVHARELRDMPSVPNVTGKKGTVGLALRDGKKEDVPATIYDGKAAVHKGEDSGWRITHVGTGVSIASARSKPEAESIAKRMTKEIRDASFWSMNSATEALTYKGDALTVSSKIASQERVRSQISAEAKKLDDVEDNAMILLNEQTDFPTQGDTDSVSLRNSQYDVFDPDYADDIRENWPEIWNAGGNDVEGTEHSGDDQYRRLKPVVGNNGAPETETEVDAVRRREAWAARHYRNNRLAGVVALMKWFVVGEIGERGMKAVMNERKQSLKERQMQQKNVRQHLHDGLAFVDDTVNTLSSATPTLMTDMTSHVLRVLSDSKDYSDARDRLKKAFPEFNRDQLRDALTGGLLLAQLAGRETVQREVGRPPVSVQSKGKAD